MDTSEIARQAREAGRAEGMRIAASIFDLDEYDTEESEERARWARKQITDAINQPAYPPLALDALDHAKRLIQHYGANQTERGNPHPQQGVLDKLDAALWSMNTVVESYQKRVGAWVKWCFGERVATDRTERNYRFFEEAVELVQSIDDSESSRQDAHRMVDHVFDREPGDPFQEVGGVTVTLACLCEAHNIDMDVAAETELARIWTKANRIREKQKHKPMSIGGIDDAAVEAAG